jgi:hypothetical protein
MYTPRLGVLGLHKRTLAAVAAVSIVALLALAASMALMQPATVAPKGGTAEGVGLKGTVDIVVRDAQGNVKYQRTVKNTITAVGLDDIIDAVFYRASGVHASPDQYKYITFFNNTGSDSPYVSTQVASIEASPTHPIGTANNTIRLEATYQVPAGWNPVTVTAIAITNTDTFADEDANTAGVQVTLAQVVGDPSVRPNQNVFSYVLTTHTLNVGDSLQVTWTITVSQV